MADVKGGLMTGVVSEHYGSLTGGVKGGLMRFIPQETVDEEAPVIGSFSPALGSTIAQLQPVSFSVTDNLGLFRRVIVTVTFALSGITEVVHDGDGFVGHYVQDSNRALITNGWRYTVLRSGGWESTPSFRIYAIDTDGNEGT